jgi:outer membrane protein TolC
MPKQLCRSAIAALILLHGSGAQAQTACFENLLRQSLDNSPELIRDRLNAEAAEFEIVRARSAFLPRADLTLDASRVEKQGSLPGLESLQLGGKSSAYYAQGSLRVSLNVYNGGQDSARLDKSHEKHREALLQWRLRRAQVANKLLDAYHVLQQALLDVRAAEFRLQRSTLVRNDTAAAVAGGKQAAYKLTEAEFEEQDKRLDLRKRQRNVTAAIAVLRDLANIDDDIQQTQASADPVPDYSSVLPNVGLAPENIVTELALNESREHSARVEIPRASGRYLPSIEFYAKQDLLRIDLDSFAGAIGHMERDKRFLGLQLRWNLFEGFDTFADVKQSNLRLSAAQEETRYAMIERAKAQRDRTNVLESAKADLELELERLELSTKRLALSRLRAELGRAEPSALTLSELDHSLQQLETRRREEQLAYLIAQRQLAGDPS